MENEFSKVMSHKTDEQLIKITTVHRKEYIDKALEAAEYEIKLRGIENLKIEEVSEKIELREIDQTNIELLKVNSITRIYHLIIDTTVIYLSIIILSTFFNLIGMVPFRALNDWMTILLMLMVYFAYYTYMEYKYQKTIGKFLTKSKVITNYGERPNLNDILTRTLCRIIPFDRISFLISKNGFHDYLSKTIVIKDDPLSNIEALDSNLKTEK